MLTNFTFEDFLSYRNQSIDLLKSIDWFQYDLIIDLK